MKDTGALQASYACDRTPLLNIALTWADSGKEALQSMPRLRRAAGAGELTDLDHRRAAVQSLPRPSPFSSAILIHCSAMINEGSYRQACWTRSCASDKRRATVRSRA